MNIEVLHFSGGSLQLEVRAEETVGQVLQKLQNLVSTRCPEAMTLFVQNKPVSDRSARLDALGVQSGDRVKLGLRLGTSRSNLNSAKSGSVQVISVSTPQALESQDPDMLCPKAHLLTQVKPNDPLFARLVCDVCEQKPKSLSNRCFVCDFDKCDLCLAKSRLKGK